MLSRQEEDEKSSMLDERNVIQINVKKKTETKNYRKLSA